MKGTARQSSSAVSIFQTAGRPRRPGTWRQVRLRLGGAPIQGLGSSSGRGVGHHRSHARQATGRRDLRRGPRGVTGLQVLTHCPPPAFRRGPLTANRRAGRHDLSPRRQVLRPISKSHGSSAGAVRLTNRCSGPVRTTAISFVALQKEAGTERCDSGVSRRATSIAPGSAPAGGRSSQAWF